MILLTISLLQLRYSKPEDTTQLWPEFFFQWVVWAAPLLFLLSLTVHVGAIHTKLDLAKWVAFDVDVSEYLKGAQFSQCFREAVSCLRTLWGTTQVVWHGIRQRYSALFLSFFPNPLHAVGKPFPHLYLWYGYLLQGYNTLHPFYLQWVADNHHSCQQQQQQ